MSCIKAFKIVVCAVFIDSTLVAKAETSAPIAIVINQSKATQVYTLDGQQVGSFGGLQEQLPRIVKSRGIDVPVVVLSDLETPIYAMLDVRGALQRMGFEKIRFFIFSKDTKSMSEIEMNKKAQPFNTNPS